MYVEMNVKIHVFLTTPLASQIKQQGTSWLEAVRFVLQMYSWWQRGKLDIKNIIMGKYAMKYIEQDKNRILWKVSVLGYQV
jgi:hypothetical protein